MTTIPVGILLSDGREDVRHKEADSLWVGRELVAFDEGAHLTYVTLTMYRIYRAHEVENLESVRDI